MRKTVGAIMNPTVFALRGHEAVATALDYFIALRIGCAPVVGDDGLPVGVVGWRDLLEQHESTVVSDCMAKPARCILIDAGVADAATELGRHNLHHLVVIDAAGRLAGFVSALDVVRGLSGDPPRHPDVFPQFYGDTSLAWTSERELTLEAAAVIDAMPGLIAVLAGDEPGAQRMLWSEAVPNMQQRLFEVVARTVDLPGPLRDAPEEQEFWFRVATFGPKTVLARDDRAPTLRDIIRASGRNAFLVGSELESEMEPESGGDDE